MKQKVFPWVVTIVLSMPGITLAEMDIRGVVHVSADVTDDGSVSSATHDPDAIQVASHRSYLAFSGREELSGTVNLIWQYAAEFSADSGSLNDNSIDTQDSYIGLVGGIGAIKGGRLTMPYRQATDKLDIFSDTAADFNHILGINPNSTVDHDLRASNVLAYESPGDKKIRGALAYMTDEDQDGVNEPGLSLSALYDNQALYITFAWQSLAKSGAGGQDDEATKFGGSWNFGQGTKVGLIWESLDAGGQNNDRDAYQFNISHLSGNTTLKFAYTVADEAGGISDTGASNLSLGLFYALSRTTEWYGLYTVTGNDPAAGYGLDVLANGAVGEDVSTFSFGLRHQFDNL